MALNICADVSLRNNYSTHSWIFTRAFEAQFGNVL